MLLPSVFHLTTEGWLKAGFICHQPSVGKVNLLNVATWIFFINPPEVLNVLLV